MEALQAYRKRQQKLVGQKISYPLVLPQVLAPDQPNDAPGAFEQLYRRVAGTLVIATSSDFT